MVVLDEFEETSIRDAFAASHGQALDTAAHLQRLNTAIVEFGSQGRQVEAPDEVSVGEVWSGRTESLADNRVSIPGGASWAVP